MKCINCGTDNNLKERMANRGRCKKCQHPFVFEPTAMGNIKITDTMFVKVIAEISANNTLYFTPKQLLYFLDIRLKGKKFQHFYFYDWGKAPNYNKTKSPQVNQTNLTELNNASRQVNPKALREIKNLTLVVAMFVSPFLFPVYGGELFIIFGILVIVSIYFDSIQIKGNNTSSQKLPRDSISKTKEENNTSSQELSRDLISETKEENNTSSLKPSQNLLSKTKFQTQRLLFSESRFQNWLKEWQQINGVFPTILPSPREEIAPATINPDVTAYSFDKLVVCDSAAIAQLLIANNFHFENNCAILSITGYPQSIFATIMQMLRRNPDLRVYALHNCTPKGLTLVNHLRNSDNWFFNSNVAIIDVGLLPRQIIATQRGMFIQTSPESAQVAKQLPVNIRLSLTAEELTWLDSGNFVELESFTPKRLIQILQSGISGSQNLEIDDSNLTIIANSRSDIYAVESFG